MKNVKQNFSFSKDNEEKLSNFSVFESPDSILRMIQRIYFQINYIVYQVFVTQDERRGVKVLNRKIDSLLRAIVLLTLMIVSMF